MPLTRLKKRADFLRVAKTKTVAKTPTMLIQCNPMLDLPDQDDLLKVGFTASRRVGNAVKRNRAKRRLRALADLYLGKKVFETTGVSQGAGFDFVFIAVPATVGADFSHLLKDFTKGVRWCLLQSQPQTLVFKPQEEKTNVTLSC